MKHAKTVKPLPLFVTLTYSNDNLSYGYYLPTLVKRDIQLFFKRLRSKLYGRKISYFAVGEYGTKFKRPHYHAIIYNISRDESSILTDAWKLGIVHIGTLSERSTNYVAKYHVLRGIHPEGTYPCFSLSSHHLGLNYVTSLRDWHRDDPYNRDFMWFNGKKVSLPRYYRSKIFDKETLEHLNEKKQKEYVKPLNQPDVFTPEWYRYVDQLNRDFFRKKKEKGIF